MRFNGIGLPFLIIMFFVFKLLVYEFYHLFISILIYVGLIANSRIYIVEVFINNILDPYSISNIHKPIQKPMFIPTL